MREIKVQFWFIAIINLLYYFLSFLVNHFYYFVQGLKETPVT